VPTSEIANTRRDVSALRFSIATDNRDTEETGIARTIELRSPFEKGVEIFPGEALAQFSGSR
jgi:hypothetical protein